MDTMQIHLSFQILWHLMTLFLRPFQILLRIEFLLKRVDLPVQLNPQRKVDLLEGLERALVERDKVDSILNRNATAFLIRIQEHEDSEGLPWEDRFKAGLLQKIAEQEELKNFVAKHETEPIIIKLDEGGNVIFKRIEGVESWNDDSLYLYNSAKESKIPSPWLSEEKMEFFLGGQLELVGEQIFDQGDKPEALENIIVMGPGPFLKEALMWLDFVDPTGKSHVTVVEWYSPNFKDLVHEWLKLPSDKKSRITLLQADVRNLDIIKDLPRPDLVYATKNLNSEVLDQKGRSGRMEAIKSLISIMNPGAYLVTMAILYTSGENDFQTFIKSHFKVLPSGNLFKLKLASPAGKSFDHILRKARWMAPEEVVALEKDLSPGDQAKDLEFQAALPEFNEDFSPKNVIQRLQFYLTSLKLNPDPINYNLTLKLILATVYDAYRLAEGEFTDEMRGRLMGENGVRVKEGVLKIFLDNRTKMNRLIQSQEDEKVRALYGKIAQNLEINIKHTPNRATSASGVLIAGAMGRVNWWLRGLEPSEGARIGGEKYIAEAGKIETGIMMSVALVSLVLWAVFGVSAIPSLFPWIAAGAVIAFPASHLIGRGYVERIHGIQAGWLKISQMSILYTAGFALVFLLMNMPGGQSLQILVPVITVGFWANIMSYHQNVLDSGTGARPQVSVAGAQPIDKSAVLLSQLAEFQRLLDRIAKGEQKVDSFVISSTVEIDFPMLSHLCGKS